MFKCLRADLSHELELRNNPHVLIALINHAHLHMHCISINIFIGYVNGFWEPGRHKQNIISGGRRSFRVELHVDCLERICEHTVLHCTYNCYTSSLQILIIQ